jgi:UDP-GalNAc:undecaprenyl-phosphate GalNAc-1-phosphate transferase
MNPLAREPYESSGVVEDAKRRFSSQFYNLWYMLGLPLILSAGALLSWGNLNIFPGSFAMIALVGFAYLSVWVSLNKTEDYRAYKVLSFFAFYMSVAFILILVILAFTRSYYSRTFLASTYGLFIIWNGVGMLFIGDKAKKLLVITGGIADQLNDMGQRTWSFVSNLNKVDDISDYEGIVIDLHAKQEENLLASLAAKSLQGIPIIHAATIFEEYTGRTSIDYLAHEGLYKFGKTRIYEYVKRLWEVILVLLMSALLLPVILVTIIGIKITSSGPVLFKQIRVGKNDKLFTLYKFRSMKMNAEEDGAKFTSEEDDRITKFGKIIRKYRIDELPQFWNVLKGDMNLIGPRPEQDQFVKYFEKEIPFYIYRHKVRPGITGWAQIKGGYADDIKSTREKLEYDLYYVKNLSLSLDLLIIYATLRTILTGFGSK